MKPSYECDRCGACCMHGPVDLYATDLLREPRLGDVASLYRKPEADGRVGYLLPVPGIGCPLLEEQHGCSIHATRPSACSLLDAGSQECQDARRACGLEPLRRASLSSRDVSTTPVSESSAMPRQNEARPNERNGGRQAERNERSPDDRNGGERNRPVHEVRLGRIKAAIWQNVTENGTRHNVTVTRLYKDGDQWKDTTSFGRDDLPLVAKVVDQAHSWIFAQAAE